MFRGNSGPAWFRRPVFGAPPGVGPKSSGFVAAAPKHRRHTSSTDHTTLRSVGLGKGKRRVGLEPIEVHAARH